MNKYGVRVKVLMSEWVEIKATSRKEAEKRAEELFFNGAIMQDIEKSEYYEGFDVEVEEES
jgi:hypothetical protein